MRYVVKDDISHGVTKYCMPYPQAGDVSNGIIRGRPL